MISCGQLSTETYQRAVEIARLPDLVRGYENIKLANVALYRARLKELQTELATVSSLHPTASDPSSPPPADR